MRRRRRLFSSSPDGLGRVRWLQPARTRRHPAPAGRADPAAGAGPRGRGRSSVAVSPRTEAAGDRRHEAVERFTTAWERGDYPAM